jgi:hypothetical protein
MDVQIPDPNDIAATQHIKAVQRLVAKALRGA